jgi:integrase
MSDGIRTPEQLQQDRAHASAPFSAHAQALHDAKTAAGKWGWDQCSDSAAAHRLFIEFVGDKPAIQYGSDDAIKFLRLLQRMPVGVNQRKPYIGLSASQAIEKADQIESQQIELAKMKIAAQKLKGASADRLLSEARVGRISTTTVIKHRDHVAAVFTHLQSRLHVAIKNPFDGIRPDRVEKSDVRDDRERFSAEQIRRIFASPIWTGTRSRYYIATKGKIVVKDHRYWVPLIAGLTGMRLEEICQLWLDDIVRVDGIVCFDIWEGPERQLKTAASARRVPIPDTLIRLGLLSRVEELRARGEYRLFPALKRSTKIDPRTKLGKLGPSLTRSIGRYFRGLELADAKQAFYSFRHTVATALDEAGVATKDINDLLGHKQGGSESQRRYIKRKRVLQLKALLERVDFGLKVVERNGEPHLSIGEPPAA